VAAGEFLLGYPNVYGKYTRSPVIDAALDTKNMLARTEQGADLGRNGSYLVFRQLEQDVYGFWKWVDGQAHGDAARRSWIASKMVGRWPGGAPLTLHPDAEPAGNGQSATNEFLYAAHDPHGQRCPFGSHVRRMNPRDALGTVVKAGDETLANAHRLVRRGRAYGKALANDMRPESILAAGPDGVERGLHFLCLNANIERQFEFVQQTWANSSKFEGLRNDPDPLIGARALPSSAFTVQSAGIRHRYVGMPSFVKARGGAYFFLPSVRAVKYLGSQAASG
jgi:Dyp-type peroxidase family